ncbi:hypothetical protein [Mesorhizobium sp. M0809]|uniref:hypothetical protein n=1 Tax=Mesorhizobium sp. M0809 TaxID=2957003 RepID=UPI00333C523F
MLHIDDLIEPGAEKILLSRLALLAWPAHRLAPIHCDEAVNHASPGGEIANWNCKKTIHKLAITCNSEA